MAFSANRFGLALWTAVILAFAPLVSTAHQTTMLSDDPTLAPVRSVASLASVFVSDWIGDPGISDYAKLCVQSRSHRRVPSGRPTMSL